MKSIINALKVECDKVQKGLVEMERRQDNLKTALQLVRETNIESQGLDPNDLVSVRAAIRATCDENRGLELSRRHLMPCLPGVSDYTFAQAVKNKIKGVRRVGSRAGRKYTSA
jgi:hypothetical protein